MSSDCKLPDRFAESRRARLLTEARVLRSKTTQDSDYHHAMALWQLLMGDPAKAVDYLSRAAELSSAAALLNDLAAAHVELAEAAAEPANLVKALEVLETALQAGDTAHAAPLLFNRALVLEKLGLLEAAGDAWRLYRQTELDRHWRADAAARILSIERRLEGGRPPDALVARIITGEWRPPARFDGGVLRELILSPLLRSWSEAVAQGRTELAQGIVGHWLALGRSLVAAGGDATVLDLARTITERPLRWAPIADRYLLFARARELEAAGRSQESRSILERLLSQAEVEPAVRHWSALALAGVHLSGTDFEETERLLRVTLAGTDPERYPAILAKAHWYRGLARARQGRYQLALDSFASAEALYSAIGEGVNQASIWMMQADLLRILGAHQEAWRRRAAVLLTLGARPASKFLHNQLWEAGVAAAQMGLPRAALVLNREDLRATESLAKPLLEAEALYRLADTLRQLGLRDEASSSLERARAANGRIVDRGARLKSASSILAAEARLIAESHPVRAVAKLQQSIAYLDATRQDLFLPETLSARAALHAELARPEAGLEDLYKATTLLEQQRQVLAEQRLRSEFLEVSQHLFDPLVSQLALERDDQRSALRELERARSMESADPATEGAPVETLERILPPNMSVLTYFVTRSSVITWRIRRGEVERVGEVLSAGPIERAVRELSRGIREELPLASLKGPATLLFDFLIRPALNDLEPSSTLVLVPDRFLQNLPFSALWNSSAGSFLVEQHAHSVAPSLRWVARSLRRGLRPTDRATPALLITDPSIGIGESGPLGRLPGARRTGIALADWYEGAIHLTGKAASLSGFASQLAGKRMLHLAVHAVDHGVRWPDPYFVLAHDELGEQHVAVADLDLESSSLDLVLLAACSSSTASDLRSRTMTGLARQVGGGGARSVVGALWPIDDEGAAKLFLHLHRELISGVDLVEAVRRAQISQFRSGRPPRDWAALQLIL